MVESTGNPDLDREKYIKMLPEDTRQVMLENIDGKLDQLKKRF